MNMGKRFMALLLALVMVLGFVPASEVNAAAAKESRMMASISTGDSTFVAENIPCWTKESIDALLDLYEDFGMARVYWRGLQNEMWNQSQYQLQNGIRGTYHSEGVRQQFLEFEAEVGMTIDEYFVAEAHKRGIEVFGTTSLADFGSGFDVPINSWPATHNAVVRMENPDWVPKDKYGLVDQGGALEYSIEDVRDWYIDLHVTEMEKVGYDGILFITYSENYSLNYNDQYGFSDEAVQEFYNRYGIVAGKDPFSRWASIYDWQRLRGEYLTQLFRELKTALAADGEEEQVALFIDPRDPWRFQSWNASDGILSDGIYLDLFAYVKEGLIDQFVCNGASAVDAQLNTINNMIQLCEGTDTEVALYTSNANAGQWDVLEAQGIDVITYGSHEAMLYNRAPIAGDPAQDADLALRVWLAALAENKTTLNLAGTAAATIEDLTPYLFEKDAKGAQGYKYNITIRRLAVHALKALNLEGVSDVLEQVLLTDPEPAVQAMTADCLRYVGDSDSINALIESIYRYDEFATVEAAAVAMYANVNKAAWQSTLKSAYATYAADNYNNSDVDNLRVCANILRALSSGGYNDVSFYQDKLYEFGPNNNTEVFLNYQLEDVQVRLEAGKALAIMDEVVEEMWYDAIRYYAASGIGTANTTAGFEVLFDLALGEDPITSTAALISIGKKGTSSAMAGQYRTRALEVMDTVFGACGDGSERVDRDWIYRPLGAALETYGDDGIAVLEKYLNGEDKILALYAWRDLYIPWTPGAYNEMTTSQYEEAYLKLPDSLKEFTLQSLSQDWEDKAVYYQAVPVSSNGYLGDSGTVKGRWGAFNAGGIEVSNFVREGSTGTNSVKLVRGGGTGSTLTGTFPALTNGQSYRLSLWVYRTKGGIFTLNFRNAAGDSEVQVFVKEGGNMVYYDHDAKTWGSKTLLTVPEDQWVQLSFEVNRQKGEAVVSMTSEEGVCDTAQIKMPVKVAEKLDRITLGMGVVEGGTAYFDDISVLTATPVRPERSEGASLSMSDATVRYDGTAHALTATTNMMGDTVPTITYKKAYAPDAVETEEAPVNAGTYLVTATAEFEGKTYTAEAKLTIVPANAVFDASKVSATEITYGQQLKDSQLTLEDGALIGLKPVETTTQYKDVDVTVLEQNFDGVTLSGTSFGDAATTAGRWSVSTGTLSSGIGGNATSAAKSFRNTTQSINQGLAVAVNNGAPLGKDYTFSAKIYREENANFTIMLDNNKSAASGENVTDIQILVDKNGTIGIGTGYKTVTGLTMPAGKWVELKVFRNGQTGKYTLALTVDGVTTLSENSADALGAAINRLQITPSNGVNTDNIFYTDDVKLSYVTQEVVINEAPVLTGTITWNNGGQFPVVTDDFGYTINIDDPNYASVSGVIEVEVNEPEKKPVYETVTTTVMEQNFEDTALFNTTNTSNSVGAVGTKGGKWHVTGGFGIIANTDNAYGGSGQSVALERGGRAQLYGTLATALSKDADFAVNFKMYRPDTMGFTFTMGEVSFYAVNNGQLKISKDSNGYDTYTSFGVPADQWIDVKIVSDRANGNYTITLTKTDGTVVGTATSALYSAGSSERLTFGAQASSNAALATPYNAGYIDDVLITTTATVEVDITEYEKIAFLQQDFEALNFVQDVNTTTAVSAGVQADIGGRWFRYSSSVQDADLIAEQNGNKVFGIYRDSSVSKYATVNITNGVAAGEAFTVSFDYNSAAQGDMTLLMNGQYLFRWVAGGNIRLFNNGTFSSVVEMVAPREQWVNFQIDVAADGTFTLTMTDADGNKTTAANKGSISNTIAYNNIQFNNNSKTGLVAYVDNVQMYQLVEKGPEYLYTDLMEQDFEDQSVFALDQYNASNYVYPSKVTGNELDGSSFNINGDIVTLITEEDGSQYYRVRRLAGETGYQCIATSVLTAGLDANYEWSVDIKTDTGAYFTMGIGQGTYTNNEMSFEIGPDYIKSLEDTSKSITFPQGQWTTVKFVANRENGTYTFSVGDQSATVSTKLVGTIDVTRLGIWGRAAQENNNIYLDNLTFTKAELIPPYDVVDVVISDTVQTYDGTAKKVSVSTGEATEYDVYYNGSLQAPTAAGTYEVQAVVTQNDYRGSATATLTIAQATPSHSGKAVTYAQVDKGDKLADIDLGIRFTTPGVLSWDGDASAELTVSGDYGWSFIPTDGSNYKSISGNVYVNVQGGEDAVAVVGDTTYASLQKAINNAEAGQTITLIGNVAESGVTVKKDLTIDFAGKAYTVTEGTAVFAEGAVVELKNGTLTGNVSMLLQNAADLTLTDMVLSTTGTAIYNGPDRALTIRYTNVPEAVTVSGSISINGASNVAISGGIFTAAVDNNWCADGYQGVQLANGTWMVMDKELCNSAKIGSTYYADLSQAIEEANDGETVVLLRDEALDELFISGSKVLDLNGNTLSVPGGLVTFAGQVIDSTDGAGLLVSGADNVIISRDNLQLPLYDSAAGGYRFFTYCLDSLGAYTGADQTAVFGVRMTLTNAAGYDLLGSAQNGMTLKVTLRWEGMECDAPEYNFSSALMRLYAEKIQRSSAYALLLRVSGAEGKTLTVEPSVDSLTRMGAKAETITHTVEPQE